MNLTMFGFFFRQLWRIIIFALGAYVLHLLISAFWPNSGGRLATFFAFLIIYCIMAYAVIPALFRLYHFLVEHDHIPLYVTYGDGWASDPVNIAIVAKNKQELRRAMQAAGWYEADPNTFKNSLHEAYALLFNRAYPTSPVSKLYLFNRRHDIAFQIPTNGAMSPRTRHHVRFWHLQAPLPNKHDRGHFAFWSHRLMRWLGQEKQVWIGAATYDFKPFDIRWRTGSITHGVRHNADEERDFIIQTLRENQQVKAVETSNRGEKFKFRGQSFRTIFTTDGSIKIVRLK
jgi:hypothetical protein